MTVTSSHASPSFTAKSDILEFGALHLQSNSEIKEFLLSKLELIFVKAPLLTCKITDLEKTIRRLIKADETLRSIA